MRLLPEYRKASRSFGDGEVGFGTVDCAIHSNLCHMVSLCRFVPSCTCRMSEKGRLQW